MKKTGCVLLCVLLLLLLWGCDDYSKEEAEKQADEGRHRMEAFLLEHMPAAAIAHSEAVEEFVAGGRHTLTEYVKGTYRESANSDVIWEYWINLETGEIYTSEHWEELLELLRWELLQAWQLGPDAQVVVLEIAPSVLPHTARDPNAWESSWEAGVLPFGTDVSTYLENWQERDLIRITDCVVVVPEETDLSACDLEAFQNLSAGVELEQAVIRNSGQRITVDAGVCRRWVQEDREDCILRYVAEYRPESGEGKRFAPPGSVLKKTAEGYEFSAGSVGAFCEIELCAREGMALLDHEYTLRRPDYSDMELEWEQEDIDLWVLHGGSSLGRKAVRFDESCDGAELIVR